MHHKFAIFDEATLLTAATTGRAVRHGTTWRTSSLATTAGSWANSRPSLSTLAKVGNYERIPLASDHMICPVCSIELHSLQYEGVAIEECEACEGHWLDAGELSKIIQARQIKFDQASRRRRLPGPSETPTSDRKKSIARFHAPVVLSHAGVQLWPRIAEIVVNRCPEWRWVVAGPMRIG